MRFVGQADGKVGVCWEIVRVWEPLSGREPALDRSADAPPWAVFPREEGGPTSAGMPLGGSIFGRFDAYLERIHPDDRDRVNSAIRGHLRDGSPRDVKHRLMVAPGHHLWVHARGPKLERSSSARSIVEVGGGWRDGERRSGAEALERNRVERELEASRGLYHSLVEHVPYAIFRKDRDGRYTFANRRFCQMHSTNLDGLLGKTDYDFYPIELAEKYREDDRRTIESREVVDLEEEHLDPSHPGGLQIVHTIKCPIHDSEGHSVGIQGMFADITERRLNQRMLEHQATHDSLTGLANRALFYRRLEEALTEAEGTRKSLAVLLVDLDRFKEINDTFGHHYGDLVLQEVAARFRAGIASHDMMARLGGDEFGVVLPGCDRIAAGRVADRLVACLGDSIEVEGHRLGVGASVGIALFPEHGADRIALVRHADIAMYASKKTQAGPTYYAADQATCTPGRLALATDLRDMPGTDQFLLHYQPKVDLDTGRPCGVEGLMRWQHPRLGLLPPDRFIPLAEQKGLIHRLDLWAIAEASRAARDWGWTDGSCKIAVNLSAATLFDPLLAERIARDVEASGLPAGQLLVEVTEGAMLDDPRQARAALRRLHEIGVTIAIDDFGTGYSSLAYLKDLPIDEVKIDRTFVGEMAREERHLSIVRAVVDLGHNLGLRVTAEGVEDAETLALLADLGCDFAQGFHIAEPMAQTDLHSWLALSPMFPARYPKARPARPARQRARTAPNRSAFDRLSRRRV